MFRLLCGILGIAWFGVPALAQQPAPQPPPPHPPPVTEEITVSARGYPTPISGTPGGVGVVHAQDIEERQPRSVSNALIEIPGLTPVADGAWGSDINIRGLSRDSVVFLIDGARVETANTLAARFGYVDPMDVERIEVLKGPSSALFGSGSLGGVVQVVTKKGRFAEQPFWEAGLGTAGDSISNGTGGFGFAAYNGRRFHAYLAQGFRRHHSYRDGTGREVTNSQFRDRQQKIHLGFQLDRRQVLEVEGADFVGRDIGIPGAGTAPLPAGAFVTYPRTSRRAFNIVHTFARVSRRWQESRLQLSNQEIERKARIDHYPATTPLVLARTDAEHRTLSLNWTNRITLGRQTLVTGLDGWRRKVRSQRIRDFRTGAEAEDNPLPRAEFEAWGWFLENSGPLGPKWRVNVGGRFDRIVVHNAATRKYSKPPTPTTPNPWLWPERTVRDHSWNAHLGLTRPLAQDRAHFTLLLASGYRAASLEERFDFLELGGGIVKWGNPELAPERSMLVEAGIDGTAAHTAWRLSAFHNRLKDLITDQFEDPKNIRYANIGRARIEGVEGGFQLFLGRRFRAFTQAAFLRGDDLRLHRPLPNIPPFSGAIGLGWKKEPAWAALEVRFAGRQNRVPNLVQPAPGWSQVDLRWGYTWHRGRMVHAGQIGIDNLFDKGYRDYLATSRGSYFSEPGRSWVVGYRLGWSGAL